MSIHTALCSRRTAGAVTILALGLLSIATAGCASSGGSEADRAIVVAAKRLQDRPTCADWLAAPDDIRRAFARGFAARTRERLSAAGITADEVQTRLEECRVLEPRADVLQLLAPLVSRG